MKKVLICLFLLVLCSFICFSSDNKEEEKWKTGYWLDVFGDPTSDSYVEYNDGSVKIVFETGNHSDGPMVTITIDDYDVNKHSYQTLTVKDQFGYIWEFNQAYSAKDKANQYKMGILAFYCLSSTSENLRCIVGSTNDKTSFSIDCSGAAQLLNSYISEQFSKGPNFEQLRDIEFFIIPDGVEEIGPNSFYRWRSLTHITIPSSVSHIGASAFYGCEKLSEIVFASDSLLSSINSNAFYDCSNLSSISIPDSVTDIGSEAFRNCSGLTTLCLPSSLTHVGNNAFKGCSNLEEVHVSSLESWLNTTFDYSSSSQPYANPMAYAKSLIIGGSLISDEVVVPDGVERIPVLAFSHCDKITSVVLPQSVKSISVYAFDGCSRLKEISMYSSVSFIGENAFRGCSILKTVNYYGTISQWKNIKWSYWDANPFPWNPNSVCNVICKDGTVKAH